MRKFLLALILTTITSTPLWAHWEVENAAFPWATPGQIRWLIDYSTMNRSDVQLMVDAGFNFIQGGGFTPDALELAKATPGVHTMMYICSRTIYHELLFPKYPELKNAAILNPDGTYKIIYNNPKRYAGCWNRPEWLAYVKGQMDAVQARGVDTIFFDNPMTWACYCPTCQELFAKFAREKTGQDLKLGQFGKPTELENWFTIDTAERFWTQIRDYAHSKGIFIVANNMTYWLVNRGLTDGVFSESGGHAPFQQDVAAYKIGLAASHGKPTGILDYIPLAPRQARGKTEFNGSQGSGDKWVGAPIAEEFEVGYAQGIACGGNYESNFSLELGRRIEKLTNPEDKRIVASVTKYNKFVQAHPEVYAKAQPGAKVGVLYSLTIGPRNGEILGMNRGQINKVLWTLNRQGVPAEVVVEDDLTPERLAGYGAVVLSDVSVLEPSAAQGLAAFAKAGGTVVVAGGTRVRGRYEPSDKSRALSTAFPGAKLMDVQVYGVNDFDLDGYELQPPWLKVTKDVGKATVEFKGAPGKYRATLSYFDESDGQGSFELQVEGRKVGSWQNTADDDQMHAHVANGLELKPGMKLTVIGNSGGGEYGRIERLVLTSDAGENVSTTRVGKGRLLQAPAPVQQMAGEDLQALVKPLRELSAVTAVGEMPEKVLLNVTRSGGATYAHIVNYSFKYDDKFALTGIEGQGPIRLRVRGCKAARLLGPEAEAKELVVKGGVVEVPEVRIYGVVELR
ncbi:MAG: hypothetical protein ABFE08_18915 [Armatimonadia bacterium]